VAKKLRPAIPRASADAPRVWCLKCSDTGLVTIWSAESMKHAIEHVKGSKDRDQIYVATCAVPCTCKSGDRMLFSFESRRQRIGQERAVVTASHKFAVPVAAHRHRQEQVEDLIGWARGYLGDVVAARDEKEAPYRVFDSWNERGE
jgi:hypothetical protein